MNKNAVYQKSAKGVEAIATRQHGLGPKQRSMLILVDGKKAFDDLAKLAGMLGDPAQLLDELQAGGFIEPVDGNAAVAASATGPVTSPSPLVSIPPTISLPDIKRLAVRKLTDAMGPMSEELCLRLESARTLTEFQAAVARAESMLRQVRGAAMAAAFVAEIEARNPPQ